MRSTSSTPATACSWASAASRWRSRDEEKEAIAYHEAGHAVLRRRAAERRPGPQGHDPPDGHGARRHPAAAVEERHIYSQDYIEDSLVRAPWAAASPRSSCSAWCRPAPTTTSSCSTELARKMVREWGMSDRIGPMAWGSQGQVFLGEDLMHTRDYSDETARVIDEEVEQILRDAGGALPRRCSPSTATGLDLVARRRCSSTRRSTAPRCPASCSRASKRCTARRRPIRGRTDNRLVRLTLPA